MIILAGAPFSFNYRAYDVAATSLFVAANIYDVTGGSPTFVQQVAMLHVAHGLYVGKFTGAAGKVYEIDKIVYTDGTYTDIDGERSPATESFQCVSIQNLVWDSLAADHVLTGSFGLFLGAIKTVTDLFSFASGRVIAKAEVVSDKGGYTTTTADKNTLAARIWNEPLASHTTAGSSGKTLADAASNGAAYQNRMSTVFRTIDQKQDLIVWAEKSGQRVAGTTNAAVAVKDADGGIAWQASLSTPNADGVYRFTQDVDLPTDSNYYVVITITVDGQPRTTQQPFFSVG